MIDNIYKNSFKEIYDILQYTDSNLVNMIPSKFINFLKENMNVNYKSNININLDIDKQPLLKETEAILSLIYRSYWATDDEKIELNNKYKIELLHNAELDNKKIKDINEIFEKRKNINKITIDNNLMIISKENFFTKIFNKIKRVFSH